MSLEPATAADVADVTGLLNEAYGPAEAFLYDGPRTTPDEVAARLAKGTFLLRRSAEGLDGCVYLEARGERGYLGMLAVSPRRQGTGLGRSLVRAGEAFLRERGVERLEIEVIDRRDELFGFYERLGFHATSRRPFEEPRFRVPVQLVVMEKSLLPQDPSSPPPA
jgi:ribosomal protein S18 acetylase RimI-like enzyme